MTSARKLVPWAARIAAVCALTWGCGGSGGDSVGAGGSGSSDCPSGEALCAGSCVDVLANPASCGACSRACSADRICDQGVCRSKAQGCDGGRSLCGGGCVDLREDERHCGACDNPCPSSQTCELGACTCPMGKAACGSACVDLANDSLHCGSCGTSCSDGRTCMQGACRCSAGKADCGDACVDITSDDANCGACGTACGADKSCIAARCACSSGKLLCGAACVDTSNDAFNCGACGAACSLGQTCNAGQCSGGGATGPDACAGLAQGVSASQIAVYQSVSVPIMKDGAEVPPRSRNADVVVGRDALFRVFVSTSASFSPRQLSARVFVQNGTSVDTYFAKATIAGPSQEGLLGSTFQVVVPKEKITLATRYALEIVECGGTPSGGASSPRFPASDGVALGARETGAIKIALIPMVVNSMRPDVSDAALGGYRAMMLAMYPITALEFSVGEPLTVSDATDWMAMLDQLRAKRQLDRPAPDVYYYGLLKPAATFRDYCGTGCTAGIGYVPQGTTAQQASQRAAVGLAFGDASSWETMAHEVGHNHGRDHAPCPQSGISGVDASYPYPNGALGVYGWDARSQTLIAPSVTDIMGYCSKKWISDYTYDGLVNRVALVNGAPQNQIANGTRAAFRILLTESRGARWGRRLDEAALPAGVAEEAEVLDAQGSVVATTTVYRTPIPDIGAHSIEVPPPAPGWFAVRVKNAGDIVFEP